VEKDKSHPKIAGSFTEPQGGRELSAEMQETYRRLEPELRRARPNPEAIAAGLEAVQRLAAEASGESGADDVAPELVPGACPVCRYRNREESKFCGMCGAPIVGPAKAEAAFLPQESPPPATGNRPMAMETHHYHHHYHHHYFPGGYEGGVRRGAADAALPEVGREDKLRPNAAVRGDMSRAEAAVRRITHEWVLACNTKHLDDLLELYTADPLVLRSNYPPARGAAAVREFFFAALDAGLGEVEVEPLRVEVVGDLAYEAGRCKALVPGAAGKRREERAKYLWVFARQSNSEWRLAADCWSSDLSLTLLESDIPPGPTVKTSQPRK
jgi:uncharacterized protein (TIGR02246 family)